MRDRPSDGEILLALYRACLMERGGWDTPLPVAELMGVSPQGAGAMLARLERAGLVERWSPRGGINKLTFLYRPVGGVDVGAP